MRKLHRSQAEKGKTEFSLLSPKPNFEKIVFYLLVLLLPTQFGKHFWPAFSQVLGIRVDYLSPTLYVTDLLILLLFLIWLKRHLSLRTFSSFVICHLSFVIFFFYLLLNILFSGNPLLGFYGFGKIFELFFLGCYVSESIKSQKNLATIASIFSITVIGESLLAISQYIHQGSLNGVLYYLGERKFTSMTPGIANASINGELILRPYGTFPHPNVLAGFLLCSLILIYAWLEDQKDIKKKLLKIIALLLGSLALFLTLSRVALILWFILIVIAEINWLLTLRNLVIPSEVEESHTTKLGKKVFLLDLFNALRSLRLGRFKQPTVGMTPYSRSKKKLIIFLVYICLTAVIIIGVLFYIPVLPRLEGTNFTEEAFSQRADLFKSTLIMIKDHPLFGVGLLNFLPGLSLIQKPLSPTLYLQPVHNIFLLITAELGIIGLALFLWFLFKTYKHLISCLKNQHLSLRGRTELMRRSPLATPLSGGDKGVRLKPTKQSPAVLLILLSVILVLGLFDHYWLTLQQGQLLFALILGLCWSPKNQ